MLELGDARDEGHREVGEAAARTVELARGRRRRARRGSPKAPRRRVWTRAGSIRVARRRGRPRRRPRRVCVTATSSWSRHRAGSASTVSSTACARLSSATARADDRRADPGPAPGLRADGHPHVAVHPPAPYGRLRQADPRRGPREPLRQGRDADDGRAAHRRGRPRHLLLPARRPGRLDVRATRRTGRRRRSSAPSTTTSTPGRGRGSGPARS